MKNLKSLILSAGLVASFGLTACGGGGLGDLKKFKDEACACKDEACVTEATKKMSGALKDVKESDAAEAKKVFDQLTACLTKAAAPAAE